MSLNEENGASSTVFDAGLELIKADFHLHTQKDKEFSYTGEQNDFVKSYIDALKQANIGVGVLTNHNKFDKDEYKAIKKRANREGIFILPGVELTVKEGANGVHTLIVFNPDEWLENGNNYIQTFLTTALHKDWGLRKDTGNCQSAGFADLSNQRDQLLRKSSAK